jgi:hypothetical protein
MDDKFHVHLHLPVPCSKEEAITFSLLSHLYMFELTEARCMCGILDSGDVEEGGDGESIKDLHDGAGRGVVFTTQSDMPHPQPVSRAVPCSLLAKKVLTLTLVPT